MDGGDSAMTRVNEQKGNAIRGLNAQEQTLRLSHERIPIWLAGKRSPSNYVQHVGVNLSKRDYARVAMPKCFLKAAAVCVNPLATVPIRKTQIETASFFERPSREFFNSLTPPGRVLKP